ncbi:outer membrane protein [Parerythrobacter jejuensis]|uniref:Outer membrane beta-barrel protein n=1 Tax=Parerythrobacter jejuensis TaxID=795812 RepID=A0A845AS26_9SPHN|nr:outer membrane beta-barrel protein [Parerythrobacter jejuensis]MXP31745.1 outer membrane beta-barrel protein [Parerythrobacter jejuensis]
MRIATTQIFSLLLATGAAILLPTAAFAQDGGDERFEPEGGFYVTLNAGVTSPSDETFEGIQAPVAPSPGVAGAPANVAVGFDDDFTFAGAVGYQIPKRLFGVFQPSVELEYSYASPDVSGGAFNGGNQTFEGDIDVNTFTINYRSELRLKDDQRVVPFWGGGIGIADVDANVGYFPNNGVANAPTFGVQGSDTGLVLHSNAGVSFRLTDKIDLEARVRYQRVSGLDFERTFVAGGNSAFNADVSGRYETVSGLAGLRFRF